MNEEADDPQPIGPPGVVPRAIVAMLDSAPGIDITFRETETRDAIILIARGANAERGGTGIYFKIPREMLLRFSDAELANTIECTILPGEPL